MVKMETSTAAQLRRRPNNATQYPSTTTPHLARQCRMVTQGETYCTAAHIEPGSGPPKPVSCMISRVNDNIANLTQAAGKPKTVGNGDRLEIAVVDTAVAG